MLLDVLALIGITLLAGASDIAIGDKAATFTAGLNAHMIGDCRTLGYIVDAVRNAADVAAQI